jgi:hypothetical protein
LLLGAESKLEYPKWHEAAGDLLNAGGQLRQIFDQLLKLEKLKSTFLELQFHLSEQLKTALVTSP